MNIIWKNMEEWMNNLPFQKAFLFRFFLIQGYQRRAKIDYQSYDLQTYGLWHTKF